MVLMLDAEEQCQYRVQGATAIVTAVVGGALVLIERDTADRSRSHFTRGTRSDDTTAGAAKEEQHVDCRQ